MNSRDWFALAVLALLVQCATCRQLEDIERELYLLRKQHTPTKEGNPDAT